MQERYFNSRVLAILILALGVRLVGVASRPIWYDEAFSILFSEKGLSAMLYGTLAPTGAGSADIHPLGYYTLLWLWMKAFSGSLVLARLLSIIAGLVSVYLIYLIALDAAADARTAQLGMLIASLAPFQVHYAQEIRMYSFLAMWLLLASYAWQRGSKSSGWKWWSLFAVSAALAQYTHNLAAFFLISLALLTLLQRNWRALRSLALAGTGALLLYSPWLVQLPAQFSKVESAYWVQRPDASRIVTLLLVYVTNTPVPPGLTAVALVAVLMVVITGLIQTVRQARRSGAREGLELLYLAFAAPLLLFLFSQWRAVYIERALLPSGAIFCAWLAWMIRRTRLSNFGQYALTTLLAGSFVLGLYQHVTYRDFPYGPFEALDRSLRQRVQPRDVIVHSNKLTMLPALLFDRQLSQAFIRDEPGGPADTLATATQKVLGIRAADNIQAATDGAERVWYIIYDRSIVEYQAAGRPTHPDIAYLESRFELEAEEHWDGLRVLLFTARP